MSIANWSFRKVVPGTKRDPFEAEFFTGDEDNDAVFSRTDALVRESIQNALDARAVEGPVRVRFAVSEEGQALTPAQAAPYLVGLVHHLDSVGNELVNAKQPNPPMRFLVYEDFGTAGLCGDPKRTRDPTPGSTREDFYWFWWNIGRSGKSGADRGRWGLGKTVFHSTSKINSIFGLTVRATDHRRLLMGQAVTKTHFIDDDEYPPEGFFSDPAAKDALQQPIEDTAYIDAFTKIFGLERNSEPGLSIVVPYRFDSLDATEIMRSVIIQYFVPILRGVLVVTVSGPGRPATTLDASTIRDVAGTLTWNGPRSEKKHRPPPFDLAAWALQQQSVGIESQLKPAGLVKAPEWTRDLLDTDLLASLQKSFAARQQIAIHVPLTVDRKVGGLQETGFDVFLGFDESLEKGDDLFIREGMTISRISTISTRRGIAAIVLVEDKPLSSLLGDAEGPAHNDWGRGEDRPSRTYNRWPSRVSFVKNSVAKLIEYLTPPPQELYPDLLSQVFSIDTVRRRKGGGKKSKKLPQPPPPGPIISPAPPGPIIAKPKWFTVTQTTGGFRIRGASAAPLPKNAQLRLKVAYDLGGSATESFRAWSPFEFVFSDSPKNPVKVQVVGAVPEYEKTDPKKRGNVFLLMVTKPDFVLDVRGFAQTRNTDLVIGYDDISPDDDADGKNGDPAVVTSYKPVDDDETLAPTGGKQ